MSLLLVLEILGGYVVAGASITWFVFFGWDRLRDMDAQRRMDALIAVEAAGILKRDEADRAPDLFALALEEIRNLPSREHPRPFGGWRS